MTTHLDAFESRLLDDLRALVDERHPSDVGRGGRSGPGRRRRRRRVLTAAAAVLALVLALAPGVGSDSAYSVGEGNAGTIRVSINRPEDAAGLERDLEAHGIAADITYLPDLQVCAPGRYVGVERRIDMMLSIGAEHLEIRLGPDAVRPGETFVLAWSVLPLPGADSFDEGLSTTVEADVATGDVGPCEPVPNPDAPPDR